jgi:hypothetical protein
VPDAASAGALTLRFRHGGAGGRRERFAAKALGTGPLREALKGSLTCRVRPGGRAGRCCNRSRAKRARPLGRAGGAAGDAATAVSGGGSTNASRDKAASAQVAPPEEEAAAAPAVGFWGRRGRTKASRVR